MSDPERPLTRAQQRELQTELVRAALEPLAPDERPLSLRVAVGVCCVVSVAVVVGAASVHQLSRHGGSLPGAVLIAVVFAALAVGMWGARYWAVLGFEALLGLQLLFSSLALILAETVFAAAYCLVAIALGGWLFWKLIRVMGRIQAGERARRQTPGPPGALR